MTEELFDWGSGPRFTAVGLAEMSETLSSKKIVLSKEQVKQLIPHRGGWLFLGDVEIIGNKAVANLDLLSYLVKVNSIFGNHSFEKAEITSKKNSMVMEKTITENDCQGHFTPKGLQMPGHLIMDYFQIMAERMVEVERIFLRSTWGKFIKPLQEGEKVKFCLERNRAEFCGTVFGSKGGAKAIWRGEFALRERKKLYFSPLHTLFEAMSQMAACLVYRKYDLKINPPRKVALRQSRAEINPLPLKESITLKVEMVKSYKVERKIMVEFRGESEGKIFWRGKGVYYI